MPDQVRNISDLLARCAVAAPDKPFLFSESDGRQFTYAEFAASVNLAARMLARMLAAQGVAKGDVVSLLMPNSAEYIISYFACWSLGALAGPVNSLLKEHEIEFVMNNSEAKAILVHSEFLERVENIRIRLPHLRSIIIFDNEAEATSEFRQDCEPDVRPPGIIQSDDAIIIYTSGTTGKPKGCLLTHGNVIANARQISEWLHFTEEDRLLTIMPLFHQVLSFKILEHHLGLSSHFVWFRGHNAFNAPEYLSRRSSGRIDDKSASFCHVRISACAGRGHEEVRRDVQLPRD